MEIGGSIESAIIFASNQTTVGGKYDFIIIILNYFLIMGSFLEDIVGREVENSLILSKNINILED